MEQLKLKYGLNDAPAASAHRARRLFFVPAMFAANRFFSGFFKSTLILWALTVGIAAHKLRGVLAALIMDRAYFLKDNLRVVKAGY